MAKTSSGDGTGSAPSSQDGVELEDFSAKVQGEKGRVVGFRARHQVVLHGWVRHAVHVEGDGAHCDAHHALFVAEQLDGFTVQRKLV